MQSPLSVVLKIASRSGLKNLLTVEARVYITHEIQNGMTYLKNI